MVYILGMCEIEDCEEPTASDTGLCPHHLRCHRIDGEIEERKEAVAKAKGA